MKIGDVVKLTDPYWLGFRPDLEDCPMTITKIHTGSLGIMITVSTKHGISKWKQESIEVVNESR
jgi:hypothetical protein